MATGMNHEYLARSLSWASNRELYESVQAIYLVLNTPLWKRIWTVQEALLPKHKSFQFGSIEMPWDEFILGKKEQKRYFPLEGFYENIQSQDRVIINNYKQLSELAFVEKYRYALCIALAAFRYRQASDPRDRIYTRTAMWMITTMRSLQAIIRGIEGKRDPELPSWVPDWNSEEDRQISDGQFNNHWDTLLEYNLYDASKGSEFEFDLVYDTELNLKRFRIDIVLGLVDNQQVGIGEI
ncbi:hypothetical protein F4781DRAFT_433440 [Annulohypoxylon bovei var. microspora]|nr:hypothetical protein F4781DRAFT_433440 [Annulohypoxylon bovei var. microspora]